jgi:aminoglycoside phosphotransferase family enzyme/predicted kinase
MRVNARSGGAETMGSMTVPTEPAAVGASLEAHHALVRAIVRSLKGPDAPWPERLAADAPVTCLQTHISTVILAGQSALKLKKPLALGFLDFSTLSLREHYCREEVRINRRTAPDLYRDVLPITGTRAFPLLGGRGPVIDWAVWMRRFDTDQLWDRLASRGVLGAAHIDALARGVAEFHVGLPPSPPGMGSLAGMLDTIEECLATLRAAAAAGCFRGPTTDRLDELSRTLPAAFIRLEGLMQTRQSLGAVVEGHGDLHLGNIVQHEGHPLMFDAIEFNDALRHIDRCNDIAFPFMDLLDHALPRLAWRWLSQVSEASGDHDGLPLLRPYSACRALVRAKVAVMAAHQSASSAARDEALEVAARRIELACSLLHPAAPRLVMTGGLSGSGKSTAAMQAVSALGAVRLRSDVERKRLHGLAATDRPTDPAQLYNPISTQRTHARLLQAARAALQGGVSVIVDATFSHRAEREAMRALARELGISAHFIECTAPESVLRARLAQRATVNRDASDADERVLALQLRQREAPTADEDVQWLDTDCSLERLDERLHALLQAWGVVPIPGSDPPR